MFVTSENVGNYAMRKMDAPKYLQIKFNEIQPRSILQRDDILINLVGASIGRTAIFDRDDLANAIKRGGTQATDFRRNAAAWAHQNVSNWTNDNSNTTLGKQYEFLFVGICNSIKKNFHKKR